MKTSEQKSKVVTYVGIVLGIIAIIAFYSGIVTICIALAIWAFKLAPLLGGVALVIDSLIIYYLYKSIQ